jgi:hypothetical protein
MMIAAKMHLNRSSPRKRGPTIQTRVVLWRWMPAFAGMNGETSA